MADTQTDSDPELDTAVHRVIMPLADALNAIAKAVNNVAAELSAVSYTMSRRND